MKPLILPSPSPGRLLLLISPASTLDALFEMVARLAQQGPLYVLDGGNAFQGYPLARALRRQSAGLANVDVDALLRRVLLSRTFTCYQAAALLEDTEFSAQPMLVLDFLSAFYDQGVRVADRRRMLLRCIRRLQILSRRAPVAVWVRQRAVVPEEALGFLDIVQNAAGQVWLPPRGPVTIVAPPQPTLF